MKLHANAALSCSGRRLLAERVLVDRWTLTAAAEAAGALLAESAVAKGLFAGDPWSLGVSGGFASPGAAELIGAADLIVGWGCALNMWTMRHGTLIAPGATVLAVMPSAPNSRAIALASPCSPALAATFGARCVTCPQKPSKPEMTMMRPHLFFCMKGMARRLK